TARSSTCAPASRCSCPRPGRCPSIRSPWKATRSSSTSTPRSPLRPDPHFSRPETFESFGVPPMSTLEIRDLHVSVETKEGPKPILRGVDLTVNSGETHAIMGPNGSGKSTLAYSLAGHPKYEITSGTVLLDGEDVLEMSVDERARAGMFLAMQYPVEVPGVSVSNFLRTAKTAIDGEAPPLRSWVKDVRTAMDDLRMDASFAER